MSGSQTVCVSSVAEGNTQLFCPSGFSSCLSSRRLGPLDSWSVANHWWSHCRSQRQPISALCSALCSRRFEGVSKTQIAKKNKQAAVMCKADLRIAGRMLAQFRSFPLEVTLKSHASVFCFQKKKRPGIYLMMCFKPRQLPLPDQ